jgi:hypothetical protein
MTWSPSALPRRLRLPPHRSLLLRGPSARLLGLDPRTALVVDDLPPPLARMLDELAAPVERVGLVARAVQRGADRDAAEELLGRLVGSGVLVDADGPDRVARRRAAAAVTVVGGGRLAAGIAAGIGLAGVGSVWVEPGPDGSVQERDLGTGLLDGDRGRPRAEAIADVVRAAARRHRDRGTTGVAEPLRVPDVHRPAPVRPRSRLAGRHGPARRAARPGRRCDGGRHCGVGGGPGARRAGRRGGRSGARAVGARRHTGDRHRLGRAAAPRVAGAPGLRVWCTTIRADMRAAPRAGDNHEVMTAARPAK